MLCSAGLSIVLLTDGSFLDPVTRSGSSNFDSNYGGGGGGGGGYVGCLAVC